MATLQVPPQWLATTNSIGATQSSSSMEDNHNLAQSASYSSSGSIPSDQWRRYGEARRRDLINKDEEEGGTSFHMHKKCRIQRYFQLAERVTQQFRLMYETWETNLDDTFVMGHRLVAFLEVALPQHPEYNTKSVSRLRTTARRELSWIQARMEELALRIDEEALNDFVSNDFVPEPDDDSSVSSSESDDEYRSSPRDSSFGVFDPFDLSDENISSALETDQSSSSAEIEKANQTDPTVGTLELSESSDHDEDEFADTSNEEPRVYVEFHEDDGDEEDSNYVGLHFSLAYDNDIDNSNFGMGSSFLRRVADEAVRYETDSEAMDSWAQDGESSALSAVSSDHHAPTFDPARLALREIMLNKLPKVLNEKHNLPPPPPPPRNTPEFAQKSVAGDSYADWASFDFATIRQM